MIGPADHYEMTEAVKAAYAYNGPVYIRLGRLAIETFNDPDNYHFEIGKGITLKEGNVGDIIDVKITQARKNSLNGIQIMEGEE